MMMTKDVSSRNLVARTQDDLLTGSVTDTSIRSRASRTIQTDPSEVWLPASWDYSADIVVLGYGGAGAITAITSHDLGDDVLILEKTPQSNRTPPELKGTISGGGGNTCMSNGGVVFPEDPVAGAIALYNGNWGATPMAVCKVWAERASRDRAWLDKMGIKYSEKHYAHPYDQEYPGLPGATSSRSCMIEGEGAGFFMALDAQVRKRGIRTLFSTPATELIQNIQTKEIIGVKAQNNGVELHVRARKAVVLCTGGFEFDETMKLNFLRSYPVHFAGWRYNTGDGIKMALKVGAGLWHMNSMAGCPKLWFPEYDSSWRLGRYADGFIFVDRHGRRFANETEGEGTNLSKHGAYWWMHDFDIAIPEYTRIPSFMIFDETTRRAGPIGTTSGGLVSLTPGLGGAPAWSEDNSVEIARGWIIKSEKSIEDLASAINQKKIVSLPLKSNNIAPPSMAQMNIDPDVLNATVQKYNDYCAMKKDSDFGRDPRTAVPIITPPFYAVALWPGGLNTNGGPIRNEKAQVCDFNFEPIPRLYSVGECGSAVAFLYLNGSSMLGELVAFGQIAGECAHAEPPLG